MSKLHGTARLGFTPRARAGSGRVLRGVGWLAAAALIAVGGAGLVVAVDHPATGARRPELTARGDSAFAAALPSVRDALKRASAAADALAEAGRQSASALRARDPGTTRTRLADGEALLADSASAAQEATAAREGLLRRVGAARLGAATRERLVYIQAALDAVARLPEAWSGVAGGAGRAAGISAPLAAHDQLVFEATAAAREERYAEALQLLTRAAAELGEARRQTDRLPPALDHPTLDEWLGRSAAYSTALTTLYALLDDSGGEVTDEAAEALAEVERAQAALPVGEGAWVVIVNELAEPGMTEGLIGIERARGMLDEATAALD